MQSGHKSPKAEPGPARAACDRAFGSDEFPQKLQARAAGQVGYDVAIEREKTYPREYSPRGRVLVKDADDDGKSDLLQAIAAYVSALRE